MPDFITRTRDQITEYWNKFSARTRIQIIVASVAVIVLLVVLSIVLSRPTMIKYASGLEPSQMSQLTSALDDQNIAYEVSADASIIYIDSSKQKEVVIIADELDILSDSLMNWENAFNNSLTTTSVEKMKKFELALQDELETKIESLDSVRKAYLTINAADEDSTIFDETQKSSATVILDVYNSINSETIEGIVNNLDHAINNLSPEDISIMDTNGAILYDGTQATDFSGNVSNQLEHSITLEQYEESKLLPVLLATGEYDRVEIAFTLFVDYDEEESYSQQYLGYDGGKTGVIVSQYLNESEGTNTDASGVPGTDSNDGVTDTLIEDSSTSESSTKTEDVDYLVDKIETKVVKTTGDINRDKSSVTIVLNKYVKYYEELLEEDGTLDDISWEAYKLSIDSQDIESIEPSDTLIELVKNASQMDNVAIRITKVPLFIDKVETELPVANYISIAFMVLLVIILGFIIYRSTAPEEIEEIEPELSVEDMLATTKETQELEEIEFDDKSDTRKQIEKFVDDNPEAVAVLLRNWLNEDWE